MNQLFGETESLKTLQKVSSCHDKVEEEPTVQISVEEVFGLNLVRVRNNAGDELE